jgi:hypothetical protein
VTVELSVSRKYGGKVRVSAEEAAKIGKEVRRVVQLMPGHSDYAPAGNL